MGVMAILWTTDLSQKKTLTKYLSEKAYQVSTLNFEAYFFFPNFFSKIRLCVWSNLIKCEK